MFGRPRNKWSLFRTIQQRTTRKQSARGISRFRSRLRIEPLENRRLLAITVNTLLDENDHSIVDGDISLRDAIEAATPGVTIDFSVSGTISLGSMGELVIKKNLTINGPGAGRLSIKAYD